MEKTYVISWKSNVGAVTRQGTKLFTREEAEQMVAELNEEHPHIVHEALNLAPSALVELAPVAAPALVTHEDTIIRGVNFSAETSEALPEPMAALG